MLLLSHFMANQTDQLTKKGLLNEVVETFLASFLILMLIYWFVALPEVVYGASMEPTFFSGERILVEKVTKHISGFSRGDIVVLHPPGNDGIDYVKRIVGLPGDAIKILDCSVYISRAGEKFKIAEPYLYSSTCTTEGKTIKEGRALQLEENEYFVLGDNRNRSADSRTFGVITEDRILGKVAFRFWPFDKVEVF